MTDVAADAFVFISCSELQESIARQAEDEKELAELIEEVPLDSIHFHTHSYFLRHRFIERAYSNDFAQWVTTQVGDRLLGERLAVIDPFDYPNLEDLREELLSILRRSSFPHTDYSSRGVRPALSFQAIENSGGTDRNGSSDTAGIPRHGGRYRHQRHLLSHVRGALSPSARRE